MFLYRINGRRKAPRVSQALSRPNGVVSVVAFQGAKSAQLFAENGLPSGGGYLANPLVTKPREGQFALKVIW